MTQERIKQREEHGWLLDIWHKTYAMVTESPPGIQTEPRFTRRQVTVGHRGGSHSARTSKVQRFKSSHPQSTFCCRHDWSPHWDRPVFRLKQAGVGWTRLRCWLWKWGSAESLNLNTIHSVNDITCLQRQKLRPIVCGREKTVTAFWWNPHTGDVIVIPEFREEPGACERTVKIHPCRWNTSLFTLITIRLHPSQPWLLHIPLWICGLRAGSLHPKCQNRLPRFIFTSPQSESPQPTPPSSWLIKQEGWCFHLCL